jgi:hypothetical protein
MPSVELVVEKLAELGFFPVPLIKRTCRRPGVVRYDRKNSLHIDRVRRNAIARRQSNAHSRELVQELNFQRKSISMTELLLWSVQHVVHITALLAFDLVLVLVLVLTVVFSRLDHLHVLIVAILRQCSGGQSFGFLRCDKSTSPALPVKQGKSACGISFETMRGVELVLAMDFVGGQSLMS